MQNQDPWDELLHNVGKGWPNYKHLAESVMQNRGGTVNSSNNVNKRSLRPLKFFILAKKIKKRNQRWK